MITEPRYIYLKNATLNWAKLDKPVNPFGTEQYEVQAATEDAATADEWKGYGLNVKEKDGVFTVSLKRKAQKADGTANDKVKVVNADLSVLEDVSKIGNGSVGNVKVFQFPYSHSGRNGVSSILTAIQVVSLEEYTRDDGFEAIIADEPAEPASDEIKF